MYLERQRGAQNTTAVAKVRPRNEGNDRGGEGEEGQSLYAHTTQPTAVYVHVRRLTAVVLQIGEVLLQPTQKARPPYPCSVTARPRCGRPTIGAGCFWPTHTQPIEKNSCFCTQLLQTAARVPTKHASSGKSKKTMLSNAAAVMVSGSCATHRSWGNVRRQGTGRV